MMIKISKGNEKLGKIANFSLPPILSCPNYFYCFRPELGLKCYALKIYERLEVVKAAWDCNAAGSWEFNFREQLRAWFTEHKPGQFRIHVSGDFYDQRYLDDWLVIAEEFNDCKFLAFTKSFHLDFSACPGNLKVIWSVMPGMPLEEVPAGSRAYAGKAEMYPGVDHSNVLPCSGKCTNCMVCWSLPDAMSIIFKIH